jgi:phosphinothricin acetyltransferase
MIRTATTSDTLAIVDIYNDYILNTTITFEEEIVSINEMANRIHSVQAANLPWIVLEENGNILGYAYATPWKSRSAYKRTLEVTIYLAKDNLRNGHGSQLYQALFSQLRAQGIHTIIGCIAIPNPASIALHKKLGFKKAAYFTEVGYKFNRWLDIEYWQMIL